MRSFTRSALLLSSLNRHYVAPQIPTNPPCRHLGMLMAPFLNRACLKHANGAFFEPESRPRTQPARHRDPHNNATRTTTQRCRSGARKPLLRMQNGPQALRPRAACDSFRRISIPPSSANLTSSGSRSAGRTPRGPRSACPRRAAPGCRAAPRSSPPSRRRRPPARP